MTKRPAPLWLWAALLLALTTAAYFPGLGGDFLFDDYPNIITNERIHADEIDLESMRRAAGAYESGSYGRPIATISFAIDHALGGMDPKGFKTSGLLVHLLNTILVFLLVCQLFDSRDTPNAPHTPLAFLIALLWAAHPLQVSTVLYVVQRMETLSLLFALLALNAYLKGRLAQARGATGWPWLLAVVPLTGLGLLSKETAALVPAFCLALELTVLGFEARDGRARKAWIVAYSLAVAAAILVFLAFILPAAAEPNAYEGRNFTLLERLLTQLRALPLYLQWMALPLPQNLTFYYDNYSVSRGLLDPPTTLFGGLLLAALALSAWRLRSKLPLFSLGILWFFCAHALTSNVIPLELVFEHRNYFALLGFLLAATELVRIIPTRDGPAIKRFAVVTVACFAIFLTLLRSAAWGDPFHLASQLVAINPGSPRASSDLAMLYVGMAHGDPDSPFYSFGMREFERGSKLPGSSPLPEQGLILMAASTGQPVKDEWWNSMQEKVSTQPIGPQEIMAVTGLLGQRYKGIELDDRRLSEVYGTLLSRREMPAQLYAQYGDHLLNYLKDQDSADKAFARVVELSREDPGYISQVAASLVSEGHVRQATAMLTRADELGISLPEH